MYEIGKDYSFRMANSYHYTGKILEEDAFAVKILDIKGQEQILQKKEIDSAVRKRKGEDKRGKTEN